MGEGALDPFAHPVAQLRSHSSFYGADGLDEDTVLNRDNATDQNPMDVAPRSLKVATR